MWVDYYTKEKLISMFKIIILLIICNDIETDKIYLVSILSSI